MAVPGGPAPNARASDLRPAWGRIHHVTSEVAEVYTVWTEFENPHIQTTYRFLPGQFNMLYLPGVGEAAFSIASRMDPLDGLLGHTYRAVGNVSGALARLKAGDQIGIRGPFGNGWPLHELKDRDIVLAAGGTGLPSIRPLLYLIIADRPAYGQVTLLYGARKPATLLYASEYQTWLRNSIRLEITVDRSDQNWRGRVGVVPMSCYKLNVDPEKTVLLTCGPEIMMRFVVFEALARRISAERIFLSLERNMRCGQGACGHCQYGAYFVCRDGPVFRYSQLRNFFDVDEF